MYLLLINVELYKGVIILIKLEFEKFMGYIILKKLLMEMCFCNWIFIYEMMVILVIRIRVYWWFGCWRGFYDCECLIYIVYEY